MPNTDRGRIFEEEIYEKTSISNDWINLTPYDLKKDWTGELGKKYTHKQFCSQFKLQFKFNPLKVWSKELQPDFVFYNPTTKTVKVFEAKTQNEKGSVDEKLQTGGKKLKRLRKLFGEALQVDPKNISYTYLLKKEDFDKPAYRDTFEDIHEDECDYCFVDDNFSLKI